MCGRVVWVWDAKTGQMIRKFDDGALDDAAIRHVLEKNRFNVPPASHLPFVVANPAGQKVEIARWGFPIPQRPNGVFNTRIERAFESPMWRGLMVQHQALLVVKGFYEWKRDGGRKGKPHFVHRADEEPMLLGAITGFRSIDGEQRRCASVVTCAPNGAMAALHDRMPVVIEPDHADDWLHPGGADDVLALAKAPAGDVLAMHEVGAAVNATSNDEPSLMRPGLAGKGQSTLEGL